MQFDFGFRFNIGNEVGSGHFFRCLSIAEKLVEMKLNVIFIVNNKNQIETHLKNKKISFCVLNEINEEKRVSECKNIVKNISKLIIDLPFHNELYSKTLKNNCKIIIIDDVGNKKIYSEILVNGSIVSDFQKYSINKKITKYFSGSNYIILRSQFIKIRKEIKLKKKVQKILLIFGGSDDENITTKILPYFFNKKYDVSVVLGPSYNFQQELKNKILKKEFIKIIKNEENIAKLFAKHDLVISSSGITAYELSCLGIPSIFIPMDKYQAKTATNLEKIGFGINYGFWDDNFNKLEKTIATISDYSIRQKMFFSGRKLIDGLGSDKILEEILML
jgi:UDP-2,4-diacetamido-2,4,6-trideoxy-beta-L-altropyranose hydrolase